MKSLWKMQWSVESPILSPMTSDVLLGIYVWAYREAYGETALEQWLECFEESPPLVFSDAWGADTLPRPMWYNHPEFPKRTKKERLQAARAGKREKKKHVVSSDQFRAMISGQYASLSSETYSVSPMVSVERTHTMVHRQTGAAMEGSLYTMSGWMPSDGLDIYCRTEEVELLEALSKIVTSTGVGGGVSRGYGKVHLQSIQPEHWPSLEKPNAEVWLGHAAPGQSYSTAGKYRLRVKYGKVANGLWNTTPWKHPMILFEPGSTFVVDATDGYVGRVMQGIAERPEVRQLAFTVTVPARIVEVDDVEENTL